MIAKLEIFLDKVDTSDYCTKSITVTNPKKKFRG